MGLSFPEKGWLGASPDGRVYDEVSQSDGILEVKCPYSKCGMSPVQACDDPAFCCEHSGTTLTKKSHV